MILHEGFLGAVAEGTGGSQLCCALALGKLASRADCTVLIAAEEGVPTEMAAIAAFNDLRYRGVYSAIIIIYHADSCARLVFIGQHLACAAATEGLRASVDAPKLMLAINCARLPQWATSVCPQYW